MTFRGVARVGVTGAIIAAPKITPANFRMTHFLTFYRKISFLQPKFYMTLLALNAKK